MTRNPRSRRLLALAVLLPVLAFGACGGGDDDDAASDAGGATTTSAAAKGDDSGAAPATGDKVEIVDFAFKPGDLKVTAGTKVTFTNEDGFAHTVTAKDKAFDSGNLDQGDTFEHTFAEAGTFEYRCAIHNSMTGKVVVS
jgi:plastocyanin